MTRDEFIDYWVENSKRWAAPEVAPLYARERILERWEPRECHCREDGCKGWMMVLKPNVFL
jgi:hypothetical protein